MPGDPELFDLIASSELQVGGYATTRSGTRVRLVERRTGVSRSGRVVGGFLCLLPSGQTLVFAAALLRPLS